VARGNAVSAVQRRTRAARGAAAAQVPARARLAAIDALRGLAIVAMVAYHFAFDLRYFGVTHTDFEHAAFWLGARATILSTFLALVGVSLALAFAAGATFAHHASRVARIAGCALLVSTASYALFPQSFIYFGVLHAIALVSLCAWPLRGRPRIAAALGAAILLAGLTLADARFNPRALSWIGFVTQKPYTEDFVPIFPWAGVTLIGIGAGHWLQRRDFRPIAMLARAPRGLAFLGRHSLAVYMLHQPVLLGAMGGVLWLTGRT
jgi:uncharacterized membrane protein